MAGPNGDTLARLRELCAWCEWSEPPNTAAADACQAAADALKNGALSVEAAALIARAWSPHAGIEALVGNEPPDYVVANHDDELQRSVIADMRALVAKKTNPSKRAYLTRLFEEQIRRFAEGGGHV